MKVGITSCRHGMVAEILVQDHCTSFRIFSFRFFDNRKTDAHIDHRLRNELSLENALTTHPDAIKGAMFTFRMANLLDDESGNSMVKIYSEAKKRISNMAKYMGGAAFVFLQNPRRDETEGQEEEVEFWKMLTRHASTDGFAEEHCEFFGHLREAAGIQAGDGGNKKQGLDVHKIQTARKLGRIYLCDPVNEKDLVRLRNGVQELKPSVANLRPDVLRIVDRDASLRLRLLTELETVTTEGDKLLQKKGAGESAGFVGVLRREKAKFEGERWGFHFFIFTRGLAGTDFTSVCDENLDQSAMVQFFSFFRQSAAKKMEDMLVDQIQSQRDYIENVAAKQYQAAAARMKSRDIAVDSGKQTATEVLIWDGNRLAYPHRTGFRPVPCRMHSPCHSVMSEAHESMSPCHVRCTVMSDAQKCHVGCTVPFRMHSLDRNS